MIKSIVAASALGLFVVASSVSAEPAHTETGAATKADTGKDPNRVVCRRIETIGTRLAAKRRCQTAAQWDAEAAANRQDLERSQTQRWKSD